MKANAPKTHSSNSNAPSTKSFFNKSDEGSFFSNAKEAEQPFFSPSLLQPKLTIGQTGDKYEQEADQVADQVVQRLEQSETVDANQESPHISLKPLSISSIQRKCEACEAEEVEEKTADKEEPLQKKPIFESGGDGEENYVQTKLDEIQQDDEVPLKGEQEIQQKKAFDTQADTPKENLQSQILNTPSPEDQEEEKEEKEEEKEDQIQAVHTGSDDEPEEPVQAKPEGNKANPSPGLESRLNSSKGSGSPLPEVTSKDMGSAFETDFSTVRIHTGSDAVQMNKALGARAFTHGSDIYFNQGQYDTHSNEGKKLLAHELTHTIQQGGTQQKNTATLRTQREENNNGPNEVSTGGNEVPNIQRSDDYGVDTDGVWFDLPFRDDYVSYFNLKLLPDAAEYFTTNPDSLSTVRSQVISIFNPDTGPIHETFYFLEEPRVRNLVIADLNSWPTIGRMDQLSSLISSRHAALQQQQLLYGVEQWLENNGYVSDPALNWSTVVEEVRSLGEPFPVETLIDSSNYDRFEMFLTMVENEYKKDFQGGYEDFDATALQKNLVKYLFDVLPQEAFSEETRRLHSEKFLDDYLTEIATLAFIPDNFVITNYAPDTVQEDLDRVRKQLAKNFVDELGPEYMSLYILNKWVESGMERDKYLARLDMDSYKAELVAYMADQFFQKAKNDPDYKAMMIYEVHQKTSYEILWRMYFSAFFGQRRLNSNIDDLYNKPVNELSEFTLAIGNNPAAYANMITICSKASYGFFERVQQHGEIAQAHILWASELIKKLDLPGLKLLFGFHFLEIFGVAVENLKELYEQQEKKAREDINQMVEIHYEEIAQQIKNWVKYAEDYMEKVFIPMLKKVALERIEANRKALQYSYDNWETESEQVAARLRISALLLKELADKLKSGEIESAEIDGQILTVKDLKELKTTIKILNKEAEKRENPVSSKKAKKKIKEALDGFEQVKEDILDGDYDPLDYSSAVYRETMDRLGIGSLPYPAPKGAVMTGPVIKAGYFQHVHANKNPFLYFAVTWWKWREGSERAITQYLIFVGVGLLTLAALLAPIAAAGAGAIISGAAATIIGGIDIAVGIGLGIKGVLDAKELLRMARLDTDGSVYGVSTEAAEKALTHAWIGLALGFLALGVGALYARMMLRAKGATKITPNMVRLNQLVKTNPKLAHKLLKIVQDAGKLEKFLDVADDALLLERLLDKTKDLRSLEYLLIQVNPAKLEQMLGRVENAAQLARLFDEAVNVVKVDKLLDFVEMNQKFSYLMKSQGGVRTLSLLESISEVSSLQRILTETHLVTEVKKILDTGKVFNTDLSLILKNAGSILKDSDKLHNLNNFIGGLSQASTRGVSSMDEMITILTSKNAKFVDVVDAICYTNYKNRWDHFDIIYAAKVKGEHLDLPRGFSSMEAFNEFSQNIRSLMSRQGANLDIRVQGSSLMDLPGKVKDIDLAVMMGDHEYLQAMKMAFSKQHYQYAKGKGAVPTGYASTISDAEFISFLDDVRILGRGQSTPSGLKINSEMESAVRAFDNGLLKDSKFLSKAEKATRDKIAIDLGLDVDLSIIRKGRGFDRPPFKQLSR